MKKIFKHFLLITLALLTQLFLRYFPLRTEQDLDYMRPKEIYIKIIILNFLECKYIYI